MTIFSPIHGYTGLKKTLALVIFFTLWISSVEAQRKILDISKEVDANEILKTEYSENSVTQTVFLPRIQIAIGEVVDGPVVIWKSPSKFEFCTSFRIIRDNGRIIIARLKSTLGCSTRKYHYRYLEDPNAGACTSTLGIPLASSGTSNWVPIPEIEYDAILGSLLNRKFDISSRIDYRYFDVQKYQELGIMTFLYTPRDYYTVKKVTDGSTIIWEAVNGGKCIHILLRGGKVEETTEQDDIPTTKRLLRLYIQRGNTRVSLYFEHKGQRRWKSINRDVFYDKMENGSEEVTNL